MLIRPLGLLALALLVGCNWKEERKATAVANADSGAFTMSPIDTSRLVARVNELKFGELETDVVRKLGTPTKQSTVGPSKSTDPDTLSRFLTYTVRRKNSWGVYDSDQFIELQFDKTGHLAAIRPHNVDGVRRRP